ncbi:MAG: discoidin domain-containing protein [Deltaproteobacteria bacterium]|nr:discoidin domain-containing protein [Deltaproteobacteria bacterium]
MAADSAPVEARPATRTWAAKWIWQADDGPANTWMCFRKTFTLASVPTSLIANIAADSKYWLWINGHLVVFEGGLKRGPTPDDGYYDEVEIEDFLAAGDNTVALLVWYFGKSGSSHRSSGKGGLLFEAGDVLASDATWRLKVHPGYLPGLVTPDPNPRLPETPVRFDARNDTIAGWNQSGYDDSTWSAASEKGTPPVAPWNQLRRRPIPRWKDSGLRSYTNASGFPQSGDGGTVVATLPYNAQVTPYLKVTDSTLEAGQTIVIRTDNHAFPDGTYNLNATYVTKPGTQEFESLAWMNGHEIHYTIPKGVEIVALQYRETGYDASFAGAFSCSDGFYDALWEKAKRTLYVNMRDNYMDCPDRERAQWWGDVVNESGQAFYALDARAHALTRKAIGELVEWQGADKILFAPVPSENNSLSSEIPVQMLASIGWYGFWNYYLHTGDAAAIASAYPHVRDYLSLWSLDGDGLVAHRRVNFDWQDWGGAIDARVLDNAWYYLALRAAIDMANLTGNSADAQAYAAAKASLESNFDRVLWNGSAYRSPGYTDDTDDRANALAVVSGLAGAAKWPEIRTVLQHHRNASPYMEKYVLEALFLMGYPQDALNRMRARYADMVEASSLSTLWEIWSLTEGVYRTYNHGWAGGPLTLLSQYVAGVAPESPGYASFRVFPQEGSLASFVAEVPTGKGNIGVAMSKNDRQYLLSVASPPDVTGVVGIPEEVFTGMVVKSITGGSSVLWQDGVARGSSYQGQDGRYIRFAHSGGLDYAASLAPNLAFAKNVGASSSQEGEGWAKADLVDGRQIGMPGASGYASAPCHSAPTASEWIEIDLGANTSFDKIRLYPATDAVAVGGGNPGYPEDFTIEVRADDGSGATVRAVSGEVNPDGAPQTYDLGGARIGRFVRVSASRLGKPAAQEPACHRLRLAEVEIYDSRDAAAAYDYVDAGDAVSEIAHNVRSDPRSGLGVESGYTRRYGYGADGSWFSYDLAVPPGVDSLALRVQETSLEPMVRDYNVYLNDVFVTHMTIATRSAGSYFYTLPVTGLGGFTDSGVLTVKFEEETPTQNYDASLAALWVEPNDGGVPAMGAACAAHVETTGWLPWTRNGAPAGSTGKSLRTDAFKAKLTNPVAGARLCYQAYARDAGWLPLVCDGAIAGSTDMSLALEAFAVSLEGAPSGYHVKYRAHLAASGWQPWASDGATAGAPGRSDPLAAIEVVVYRQ